MLALFSAIGINTLFRLERGNGNPPALMFFLSFFFSVPVTSR